MTNKTKKLEEFPKKQPVKSYNDRKKAENSSVIESESAIVKKYDLKDTAMMRQHLHNNVSLPKSLSLSIENDTQQNLIDFAMANSLENTTIGCANNNLEFDYLSALLTDDEIMAIAISESLNET
jgi:hypothetical protein